MPNIDLEAPPSKLLEQLATYLEALQARLKPIAATHEVLYDYRERKRRQLRALGELFHEIVDGEE